MMIRYTDINGDSGIEAYEIGQQSLRVKFNDGTIYTYTYQSAGQSNVDQMKVIAQKGDGLNSYINHNVRRMYASKN